MRRGDDRLACLNRFNGSCCPSAQVIKEEICGNFNNSGSQLTVIRVWSAPPGDYIQGNFQVFNSAASVGLATGNINLVNATIAITPSRPGNTSSGTFTNPIGLTIAIQPGASGTYCITLYKRVLA
jgi:hypothetical protein